MSAGALAASVVILAATPVPGAKALMSAPAPAPPGARGAAAAAPMAASPVAAEEEYEARLRRFEPWALKEGGEGATSDVSASVLAHMQSGADTDGRIM